ncbi:aldehyde dehydrogenase family protein [Mycolicibacter sp. MYC123]|uniref:Aldehyde dehydrogenase family protein n=1 Tax=[Mycobacterium] zoologicum TaxID=2872311 RepID=A0ABU5YUT8_9MYCO|nr:MULTISPECIES: aldehyde dehydrogenase family protein [Mycobacteriaceae]MCG7611519.1 aldehyde dehydrogenase family protein [Mycobacterium sp. CnD-18-1]MCQ4359953.1 aldehyde dehydrogenase family protein [Mycobacterium gordonae]MEB3052493.1 aldehyde dehydrogenase family protein [Mycolicibacter sp. MYC123]UCZ59251.1 aldehyde dehydrogenase family protein [Mycolicibacterium phocaicum]
MATAHAAQRDWALRTPRQRGTMLRALATLMREHTEELALLDVEFTSAFRMIETVKPMTQPPASPLSRGGVLGGQVAFAERECTRG